jgi:hypothetical protein
LETAFLDDSCTSPALTFLHDGHTKKSHNVSNKSSHLLWDLAQLRHTY